MSLLDLSGVQAQEFKPFKPGKYIAVIHEAKVEETFSKTGKKLSVKFKVLDGEFKNREVRTSFNIFNQSEMAQKIGREQLKGMMQAMGMGDILDDVNDLLGKPLVIGVKIDKNKETQKEYPAVSWFEKTDFKLVAEDDIPF